MTIAQKAALSNLQTLANLVASDTNNKGNVHVGLMEMTDGRARIVRFDAGKELTPEMQKSCNDLRDKIRKWGEALTGTEKQKIGEAWLNAITNVTNDNELAQLDDNQFHGLKADSLKDGLGQDFINEQDSNVPKLGKPLSFKEVKTALATDERFTYRPQTESDRGRAIGQAVAKRSNFSNFLHAIGRGIMRATHAIKALFTGHVGKDKGWGDTVETYKDFAGNFDKVSGKGEIEKWTAVRPLNNDNGPVEFDASVVASSCGLSGKIVIRPFDKEEELFPKGSPSICDIKQNPALQDCWFLSSLAAVLRSQGPEYVKNLITTKKGSDHALVRLGQHQYQVPLGDVLADGKRAVSDSKPWVRILEQAMAMHFSQTVGNKGLGEGGKHVRMDNRSSTQAIEALLGREPMGPEDYIASDSIAGKWTLKDVKDAFRDGTCPLVMGSNSNASGTRASLGTGISPGHACAVLSVDDKKVTVLDPYGHVRHVSGADLKNFSFTSVNGDSWKKIIETGNDEPPKVDENIKTETVNVEGESWESI